MGKVDKSVVKDRLEDVLRYYGASKGTKGNWNCIPTRHKDARNDLTVSNKSGELICCCHCDLKGDSLAVIGIMEGITSFTEQMTRACEILNIQTDETYNPPIKKELIKEVEKVIDNSLLIAEWHKNVTDTDYFKSRGLSDEIISKYKLGYNPNGGSYGKAFPYSLPVSNEYVIFREDGNENGRYRNTSGKAEILNLQYIQQDNDCLFITEGYFDALSIEELNYKAIGLNSTSNLNMLIEELKTYSKEVENKVFILIADNDDTGKKLGAKATEEFKKLNLTLEHFNIDEQYNDTNECMVRDRTGLETSLKSFVKARVKVIKPNKISGSDYIERFLFQDIEDNQDRQVISTGFKSLDKQLGGSLYAGLYCLGAPTSLGKTTFIQQVADNIAKQEVDVLFFNLEMGTSEMVFRSLTRELLLSNPRENSGLNMGHVMYGKAGPKMIPIIEKYRETIGKNIQFIEGNFDMSVNTVKEIVAAHKRLKPSKEIVVIVDYLQVLRPIDRRMNDKQAVDSTVIELKRMSREFNIPVIAVSSFNRGSYDAPASFEAFKESGSIEFTSDCVIALQLKIVEDMVNDATSKNKNRKKINEAKNEERDIELVILKNRRGNAWAKIPFRHYSKFYMFEEMEG